MTTWSLLAERQPPQCCATVSLMRASGSRAPQRMSAKNAATGEARALNEARGAALLTTERISYDENGRAVEFAQHWYRASRFAFTTSMSQAIGAEVTPPPVSVVSSP